MVTCARITSISAPSSGCEEGSISLSALVETGARQFPMLSEAVVAARVEALPNGLGRLLGAMCFCAQRPHGIVDRGDRLKMRVSDVLESGYCL